MTPEVSYTRLSKKSPIICLSSQNWFDDMWTNKQHLMKRVSDRGFRVLYVCKGTTSVLDWVKKPVCQTDFISGKGIQQINDSLFLADSPELPLFGLTPQSQHYERFQYKLKRLQPELHRVFSESEAMPIVWAYHPGYGHYLDMLPEPYFLLYDCVDDYASFPGSASQQQWIRDGEAKLLQRANLVTTTSLALFHDKQDLNPNTYYVHNVGDYDHFSRVWTESFKAPDRISSIPSPRVGFFGALSSFKLDVPLLHQIAEAMPNTQFVLMGPVGGHESASTFEALSMRPNIHLLGKIAYDDLPHYLHFMDVLMIPYTINEHTEHVFPIKFFESLATGRPTVVTPLPTYADFQDYVYVASNADEFVTQIDKALLLDNDSHSIERMDLAKHYDWNHRLNSILELIDCTLG